MAIMSSVYNSPPSCYFIAQGLVATATILYTKNRSIFRLPSLVLVLWLAYLEFNSASNHSVKKSGNGMVAAYAFLYTAQLMNILWINSVSFEDFKTLYDKSHKHSHGNTVGRVLHLVAFNFRGIRTPWQAKNVPAFPKYYSGRLPRDRLQFIGRQVVVMAFQYLIMDLVITQTTNMSADDKKHLMGPGVEYKYLTATREQWIFRIYSSIVVRWFLHRAFLSFLYNLVSVIGVGSGIFSIEDFPPFMGSMWSAYTLRGYWGKFWHQTLRWPLTALSTVITKKLLNLPKPSLLERYTHIFVVYMFSGILHVFIDIGDGKTEYFPTMLFFLSFAFGIMVEDGAQALWRRCTGQQFAQTDRMVPTWKKVVGFIWVNIFLIIVGPWYCYPGARVPTQARVDVPIEITNSIGAKAASTTILALGLVLLVMFQAEI